MCIGAPNQRKLFCENDFAVVTPTIVENIDDRDPGWIDNMISTIEAFFL